LVEGLAKKEVTVAFIASEENADQNRFDEIVAV